MNTNYTKSLTRVAEQSYCRRLVHVQEIRYQYDGFQEASNRTLLQSTSTRKPMGNKKYAKAFCHSDPPALWGARVSGSDDLPYLGDSLRLFMARPPTTECQMSRVVYGVICMCRLESYPTVSVGVYLPV